MLKVVAEAVKWGSSWNYLQCRWLCDTKKGLHDRVASQGNKGTTHT